jgi:hypothetical protein
MDTELTLYDKVVRITNVYLGPAAERFVSRQVRNHLHKEPQAISENDLKDLIDWVRVAVSLLTENSEIVDEYIEQLVILTGNKKNSRYNQTEQG